MANDFSRLSEMIYSGRALHAIYTSEGEFGVGYTLTGRSPSSQARKLVIGKETGTISVQALKDEDSLKRMFPLETSTSAGLEKLLTDINKGSSSLIYYPAIRPILWPGLLLENQEPHYVGIVGSNGIQTDLIYTTFINNFFTTLTNGGVLDQAFSRNHFMYDPQHDRDIDITNYEPDEPNFTPRINFCLKMDRSDRFAFSIIKKDNKDSSGKREIWEYKPFNERRSILSLPTYLGGNENPLEPFRGDLIESKTDSTNASDISKELYDAIGPKDKKNYRVATAVMIIKNNGKLDINVINRVDRGE